MGGGGPGLGQWLAHRLRPVITLTPFSHTQTASKDTKPRADELYMTCRQTDCLIDRQRRLCMHSFL